ncbi:MAG: SRPBCC domain-containing protein [Acidobacteriia bacterium]|nr:SRPBCC domain-containing protein [Terriglobia bacterium]
MTALVIRKAIEVDAPVSILWKILTDNEFIPQYMFGCLADSDWQPGSPLLWRGVADGMLYVKGHIVAIEPPHRLVYTVIDPNSGIADIPSNYLTMTCELKERNAHASVLEITQGDFSTVEDGEKRYRDSNDGDNSLLLGIKQLAEARVQRR